MNTEEHIAPLADATWTIREGNKSCLKIDSRRIPLTAHQAHDLRSKVNAYMTDREVLDILKSLGLWPAP